MKAGLTELVLPDLPIPEFMSTISKAGFETAELSLRNLPGKPFCYETSDQDLKDFKQAAKDNNLSIESISISCKTGNLLLPPDEAKDAIAETAWGLECAAKLGATAALHTLGRCTPELFYEDAYNNGIQNLKTLAPICEKLNVSIACEFIWNGFLFSPLEMRRFLDEVNSPFVGFYFDTGNMAIYQYPQHWARALAKYIKRVHIKDFQGGPGNFTWPGIFQGTVDFPAVMAELKKAGYDLTLTSEVAVSAQPLDEQAAALKKLMTL